MGSVRGYPLSAYQGDRGYHLSAEYTVPFPWKVKWHSNFPDLSKVLSVTSFLEHGKVFIRKKRSGEVDQEITSAGGGLKFSIPKKEDRSPAVSFAATYSAPVFDSILPADISYGTVYLNGMINY